MAIPLRNRYSILASALMLTGILLSTLAFLILRSTPLTALGVSTFVLGAVSFAVARGQPKIPPQASAILLQSGVENISALVEEIGLKSKAVYLPSSVTGDKPKALIPLDHDLDFGGKVLPKRLIVKYGSKPDSMGLLIITPGSAVKGLVEAKADSSASDLESAISSVLLGTISLADGVRVTFSDERVLVEVTNPKLDERKMWIYESLGTPVTSIVASVVAELLDKPISVVGEQFSRGRCLVELKVVGRGL